MANGVGTEKDFAEALKWYSLLPEMASLPDNLGKIYSRGEESNRILKRLNGSEEPRAGQLRGSI